jgi:hypothetical protein
MPRVLTICPATGKPLPIGAVVAGAAQLTALVFRRRTIRRCPHCARPHPVTKADLFLEGTRWAALIARPALRRGPGG